MEGLRVSLDGLLWSSGYVYPIVVMSRARLEVQKSPLLSVWKGVRAVLMVSAGLM